MTEDDGDTTADAKMGREKVCEHRPLLELIGQEVRKYLCGG